MGIEFGATGMPTIDAQDDFRRARRAHTAARLWRFLWRRKQTPSHPRALSALTPLTAGQRRLQVVPLRDIVGTVDAAVAFDARFRPASEHLRGRWERIALAHRTSVPLPPIVVLQREDGYYVVDGRHRVSVALALGHPDIDAWVTGAASVLSGCTGTDMALAA